MSKLKSNDLAQYVYCEIYIGFNEAKDAYIGDETPGSVKRSSDEAVIINKGFFVRRFDVSDDVADRLHSYYGDVQQEFLRAVERMTSQSEKYLKVAPHLHNKKYDQSLLDDYIYREIEPRKLRPMRHVIVNVIGVSLSITVLAGLILLAWSPSSSFKPDVFGGWLISFVWLGLTLLAATSISKGYKTRRLIEAFSKPEK